MYLKTVTTTHTVAAMSRITKPTVRTVPIRPRITFSILKYSHPAKYADNNHHGNDIFKQDSNCDSKSTSN